MKSCLSSWLLKPPQAVFCRRREVAVGALDWKYPNMVPCWVWPWNASFSPVMCSGGKHVIWGICGITDVSNVQRGAQIKGGRLWDRAAGAISLLLSPHLTLPHHWWPLPDLRPFLGCRHFKAGVSSVPLPAKPQVWLWGCVNPSGDKPWGFWKAPWQHGLLAGVCAEGWGGRWASAWGTGEILWRSHDQMPRWEVLSPGVPTAPTPPPQAPSQPLWHPA